jgi:Ulp1 family protease
MCAFVINTQTCYTAGDTHRPLHVFHPLFFKALCGENAEGPYNFADGGKWLSKRKVTYNIFRCEAWFIPIHLKEQCHWVLVKVVLPRIARGGASPTEYQIRYSDSNSTEVTPEATRIMVCRKCDMYIP